MNADPRAPEYKEAERKTAHQPVTPTPQALQVLRDTMSVTCVFGLGAAVLAFLIIYLVYA
jgi:hypothetical protein